MCIRDSNEVELGMAPDGDFEAVRSFAAKAPEHAARIAAVLAVFTDPEVARLDSLAAGIAMTRFYLGERLRLAGKPAEAHVEDGNRLAEWLQGWSEEWVSIADILQRGPNTFRHRRLFLQDTLVPLLLRYGHLQGPPRRVEILGKTRREAYRVIRSRSKMDFL